MIVSNISVVNMADLILLAIIIYYKPRTISAWLVKILQVYIQEWEQNQNNYLQQKIIKLSLFPSYWLSMNGFKRHRFTFVQNLPVISVDLFQHKEIWQTTGGDSPPSWGD